MEVGILAQFIIINFFSHQYGEALILEGGIPDKYATRTVFSQSFNYNMDGKFNNIEMCNIRSESEISSYLKVNSVGPSTK